MSLLGNFGAQLPKETAAPKAAAKETASKPEAVATEAPRSREAKIRAIEALGKKLDGELKQVGTLIRLGERVGIPVPSYHLRLPSLDSYVLGSGGVPKGRIIEIYGPESAGKTTITLDIIAQVQQAGGLGAFVDAEHALDPNYASLLGVDVDNLFISQPDYGEQALQIVEQLIDSRCVDIIVVDSVTALVPKAELDGEIGDANIGLQARMMSQALRMLVGKVSKTGCTVIFINQIRDKIGVMFGNPETTTGGKALKFFASVRLDVRKTKMIGEGGKIKEFGDKDTSDPVGNVIKVKAVKNKVAAPFRVTELEHLFATGIDRVADAVNFGNKMGALEKRGSWLDFRPDKDSTYIDKDDLKKTLRTTIRDDAGKEFELKEGVIVLGNGMAAAKDTVRGSKDLQSQIGVRIFNIMNAPKEEKAA